jgi:glycosyltransferase involved in cell wall biosynthesis
MDVGIVATHISPAKGYGGVSVTASVLTKAWAGRGHKIVLVASDESIDGRLRSEQVQLGEQIEVRLYRCYGFRRWGFGLGAIPMLFKLCLEAPVVYIHGISTWPSTLAAIFCTLLHRPFMVAVHGGLMIEHVAMIRRKKPHKWLFYKWLTFPTLRRCIAVHCTCEAEAKGVRNVLGDDTRILLVPNGIDSREVKLLGYPAEEGMTLCFLGHIQPEKGINAFIKVWLKIRQPRDRLLVAGSSVDKDYFDEFQELVKQANDSIHYLGYLGRSDVMSLLADSHFLVFPSGLDAIGGIGESFGNVVAEAMAAGRPVLVTRGLAWDYVESFGIGYIFDRTGPSLRVALERSQSISRVEWERMSHNARRHIEQQFDSETLGERVWGVLTDLGMNDMLQKQIEGSSIE